MSDLEHLPEWVFPTGGFTKVGAPYRKGSSLDNLKILWHTWEGTSWAALEAAFRNYPAHLAVQTDLEEVRQYMPLNRSAEALRQGDTECVIQIEVSGFARDMRYLSQKKINFLASVVYRLGLAGYKVVDQWFEFHDELTNTKPPLATEKSPIRRSSKELSNWSGHMGHQHMYGNDHWDPGALPIEAIIEAKNLIKEEEEEMYSLAYQIYSEYRKPDTAGLVAWGKVFKDAEKKGPSYLSEEINKLRKALANEKKS